MSDPRYGSGQWKKTRKHVLRRAGGICEVQGPGCLYLATTVDHLVPVRLGGEFFAETNLRASCRHCNYSAGSRIREAGRDQTINLLEQVVHEQEQQIEHLLERVQELERDGTRDAVSQPRRVPAIY